MPVYWSMMLLTGIISILCYLTSSKKVIIEGKNTFRVSLGLVVVFVGYVVFFVGFRDNVMDTGAYISSFKNIPIDMEGIFAYLKNVDSGQGFYFLTAMFKRYISDNHYSWLFLIAIISCGCLFRTIYKYSIDFSMSAFLFIATTTFTWLLNGMRQFLVVSILVAFADWLIEGKRIRYIFLVLLLSTIHSSAIFVAVIVLFISVENILTMKLFLFIGITIIGTYYSDHVFQFLTDTSESMNYAEVLGADGGSSVFRLLIASIPIIIVLLNYSNVKRIAPKSIKLAINMNVIGMCFYFAATFTNGILIGRMPIYFTVYELYLLPWLIKNCFTKNSIKIVSVFCVIGYLCYFYYQMCIAWGGLLYVSDFLKIYFL